MITTHHPGDFAAQRIGRTVDEHAGDVRSSGPAGIARTRPPRPIAHTAAMTVALVATGLFAGFFVTYSASVVLGLARVDDLTYVMTFQAINATIRNAVFAAFFFGCVPSIVAALATSGTRPRHVRVLLGVGAVLCAAVVVVTFVGNVPLNEELATYVDLDEASAGAARDDFESTWNVLNAVRAVLSVAGLTAVAAATTLGRRTA